MKIEDLKKRFGDEYPTAVIIKGIRMPLHQERRFSRSYHSVDHKTINEVSRFMDGSASITLDELRTGWPKWTENERMDFCQSCCWLHGDSDFKEMLRFIMQHAGPNLWSCVAMSVASQLPTDEAFDILLRALRTTDIGYTANITQAIAITKHPDAEVTLRRHLQSVWGNESLWDDDPFLNWVAFDATTCIAHLIEHGSASADFEEKVRRLAEHTCSHNRDSCRDYLSKHYPWLK